MRSAPVRARKPRPELAARLAHTFARVVTTAELRNKLLFSLGLIVLFRFGASLPLPGISEQNVRYCSGLADTSGSPLAGVYAMLNVLSGNSLLHVTVFALGIMPYITASIVVQLLTQVVPRLERLKQEGQAGTAKITQYTRYLTVGLAILVSATYVEMARSGNLFPGTGCSATNHPPVPHPTAITLVTMLVTMVAGTSVIMWLGELITDRGIGNGMSVLIFTSTIAVIPGQIEQIYLTRGRSYALLAVLVVLVVVAFVVFIERAQRRIPVQYARRITGRRMYGGASTFIPVKVNQAGVVPVIFASSLLYVPQLATLLFGGQAHPRAWVRWIDTNLTYSAPSRVYFVVYFALIVAFTFFYVSITFNPAEIADNMRKYGGFIPGIRPGRPTAEHLNYVLSRLTAAGSVYLGVLALFPSVALDLIRVGSQYASSGTSLLIMVGVGLDTVKQIESQLRQHSYEGFLR
jgi:preprotein translocase subunit SecY